MSNQQGVVHCETDAWLGQKNVLLSFKRSESVSGGYRYPIRFIDLNLINLLLGDAGKKHILKSSFPS